MLNIILSKNRCMPSFPSKKSSLGRLPTPKRRRRFGIIISATSSLIFSVLSISSCSSYPPLFVAFANVNCKADELPEALLVLTTETRLKMLPDRRGSFDAEDLHNVSIRIAGSLEQIMMGVRLAVKVLLFLVLDAITKKCKM